MGDNGAGKSTMLDALCFALYGKAFRNINKPILLNSVNQKDCLVEVEFSIGKKEYKVQRGIKPGIFNIFCDGELIAQDAASKDYQSFLENVILKINFRSFTQIVILGTASFTPFMQLPAAARREVIDDILDIKIFSDMNTLLKERMASLRDQITTIDNQINVAKEKTMLQKSFIKTLEEGDKKRYIENLDAMAKKATEQAEYQRIADQCIAEAAQLQQKLDGDKTGDKLKSLEKIYDKLESRVEKIDKEIAFYHNNDICPVCTQDIDIELKTSAVTKHSHTKTELISAMEQADIEMSRMRDRITELNSISHEMSLLLRKAQENGALARAAKAHAEELLRKHIDLGVGDQDITAEKIKLKEMATQVVEYSNIKSKHNEDKQYLDVCGIMLKDTGIKTTVVREYLPVINKLINKYLTIMDFFVHFELDEAFNESIKSRYRDEFSYSSFSEGEKQRINLALLFTWRQVAKLKNSVNTNLLILDEVFDSSLDNNGTEFVMQLLDVLAEDTNIFVISHKSAALADKFHSQIKFEKKNNFSTIVMDS